jgi:hypothetical protein
LGNKAVILLILVVIFAIWLFPPILAPIVPTQFKAFLAPASAVPMGVEGFLIGVVATLLADRVDSEPKEPREEKKLHLKKNMPESDDQLLKLRDLFNPSPKPVEPLVVEPDWKAIASQLLKEKENGAQPEPKPVDPRDEH